jgi:polygalacturonase
MLSLNPDKILKMTNRIFRVSFFILLLVLPIVEKVAGQDGFAAAKIIVQNIQETSFRADTTNIADFGAIGNGDFNNRDIIMRCINQCSEKGGGIVLIPKGTFFCKGPLSLKSNTNLHLEEGALLLFSDNPADYLPAVFTRWECVEIYNYSPMIYTSGQENVAITGKGKIDGNALNTWVDFRKKQGDAQNRVRDFSDKQKPVNNRIFGEGDFLRPSFIQFVNCKRILVEGVTLTKSPLWMLHPVYCSDIIIRNVNFNSLVINNDGIDFDSSENGLVENCTFSTGDDAVVFKSGRDRDGWRVNKPTRNIVVRNCNAPQVLHGIAFGSEMSGGIENIFVENFSLGKVEGEAIQFKANKDRGGYIRNVFIRNIEVDSVGGHLLYFMNSYHSYRGGNAPSEFHNIHVKNISCNFTNYAIQLQGLEEMPLHDITIENVKVEKADNLFDKKEFYRNINLKRFKVAGKKVNL